MPDPAPQTAGANRSILAGWWRRFLFSDYLVLSFSVIAFLGFWPFAPDLASRENLQNVLASLLPLFIVAMGQTLVLITGGIDLSVTSIIAMTSVMGATVMRIGGVDRGGPSALVGVAVMLILGVVLGVLNGGVITLFRMPPFIVTLTSMMFFSGFAIWFTQSQKIDHLPPLFNAIGQNLWVTLMVALVLAVLLHLLLERTRLGRWLYATGHNARAAQISGVPVSGVVLSAYAISGLCAGVAAVIFTGRLETGDPVMGQRILLDIVGATIIGGASLFGGKGKMHCTFFGVLFITLIDKSLELMGLSNFTIMMIKGGVILMAALLDATRNRMGGRLA